MDVLTKVISRTTDPDKMVGPEVRCLILCNVLVY